MRQDAARIPEAFVTRPDEILLVDLVRRVNPKRIRNDVIVDHQCSAKKRGCNRL